VGSDTKEPMINLFSNQVRSVFHTRAIALVLSTLAGTLVARADGTTDDWQAPNSSLLKAGNWSTGAAPAVGVIGVINDTGSTNGHVLGLDVSNSPDSIGTIDFTGGTNEKIGTYTSANNAADTAFTLTLLGATLNSEANTVIANEASGTTLTFVNDATPSGKSANTGQLTLALNNSSNVIQSSGSGNNIVIDVSITGASRGLTFLGGGTGSKTGGTLELGAGSSADSFGSTNTFSGGLTIGDAAGTANAGIVQMDGVKALPTTGTITVNTNSQLLLNGGASYGASGQSLVLNGGGTGGSANGALSTSGNDVSTWKGSVSLASNSGINVSGTGSLTVSGQMSGSGQLQKTGAGALNLNTANTYSGGTLISAGSVVAGSSTALGTGAVTVSGGSLSASVATANIGGNLSLSSGSISLNASSQPTLQLAMNQTLNMTGGTLSLALAAGTVSSIESLGGTSSFDITGGTLNLNDSITNYDLTYDILTGFANGSVNGLTISDYDSTDYTAVLNDAGVLSFSSNDSAPAAVPEPSTDALLMVGSLALLFWRFRASGRLLAPRFF